MKQFVGICAVLATICLARTSAEDVEFTSEPQVVQATVNQTVTLHCDFKPKNEFLRLWYRENSVLFVDNKAIFRRDHFKLENGNLLVTVVGPEAAGEFQCRVNDPKESALTHRIELLGPPQVTNDVDTFTVKEGGTIAIHCKSSSAPKPTITYTKEGSDTDLSEFVKDGALQISDASRKNAGVYRCTASNGYAPNDSRTVTVQYEGKPDVSVAIQWVNLNSESDKAVEVTCKVASEEGAKVRWQRTADGAEIQNNEHFAISETADSSTLRINAISEDLFSNYTCVASNAHGEGSDSVEISSLPIKPIVATQPKDVKSSITLTTVSPYRVVKFIVTYQNKNGKSSTAELALSENDLGDKDGKYTVTKELANLIPDSDYEGSVVAVTAKNEQSPAARFAFHTAKMSRASGASALGASMALIVAAAVFARA